VEALGTAVANESVNLTAQQAEIVKSVLFEDGRYCKKRINYLIELSDREEKARVAELADYDCRSKTVKLNRIKGFS